MIKSKKDFYSGLMFTVLGAFFALWALHYPMGSSVRMGPAYFPTVLGGLTAVLGVIILIRGVTVPGEAPTPTKWRPLSLILLAALAFGWIMDVFNLGFVPGVFAAVFICAYGGYEFNWKEALIESVVLVAACWGLFVYALGLPFRLFPWS